MAALWLAVQQIFLLKNYHFFKKCVSFKKNKIWLCEKGLKSYLSISKDFISVILKDLFMYKISYEIALGCLLKFELPFA